MNPTPTLDWTGPGWYVFQGTPPHGFKVFPADMTSGDVTYETSRTDVRWPHGTPRFWGEEDYLDFLQGDTAHE